MHNKLVKPPAKAADPVSRADSLPCHKPRCATPDRSLTLSDKSDKLAGRHRRSWPRAVIAAASAAAVAAFMPAVASASVGVPRGAAGVAAVQTISPRTVPLKRVGT